MTKIGFTMFEKKEKQKFNEKNRHAPCISLCISTIWGEIIADFIKKLFSKTKIYWEWWLCCERKQKSNLKDFQDLEGFPEYVATDDGVAKNGVRSINQIR